MKPAPSGRHGKIDRQLALLIEPLARQAGLTGTGPFNLGREDDFRLPDSGLHRNREDRIWYPTAALVVEIVSPGDKTWDKLSFYVARGVAELLVVDPQGRFVKWFALESGQEMLISCIETRIAPLQGGSARNHLRDPKHDSTDRIIQPERLQAALCELGGRFRS